ncbi:MAG: ACP S-malonyltransferase [SAR324 cluster bacterium]|nr:ACP S-malonyltransferase [SAR324 cluster bacterium]
MTKVAFLFPGQGSQAVGMGTSFEKSPIFQEYFTKANDALGFDLQQICSEGPSETLTSTENAQPAILTVSIIALEILKEKYNITPTFAAGHSLGEYSALVAAGVLDFSVAVKVVHLRGKFMQEAVPKGIGAMAAIIGKSGEDVGVLCAEVSNDAQFVKPANYNCTGQVVVSGHKPAVERLLEKAKGKMLDVSAPFHSDLMVPAANKLREVLEKTEFQNARFPIVNNTANQVLTDSSFFLSSLVGQVVAPVRWETGIKLMIQEGVTHFIEFGNGKVLAGMMKRIDKSVKVIGIQSLEDLETHKELLQSL